MLINWHRRTGCLAPGHGIFAPSPLKPSCNLCFCAWQLAVVILRKHALPRRSCRPLARTYALRALEGGETRIRNKSSRHIYVLSWHSHFLVYALLFGVISDSTAVSRARPLLVTLAGARAGA
eukprot:5930292-Pleurochrysis_carterae.AAC.1